MTVSGRLTFEETRKHYHITRSQLAQSTGLSVDDVRALEATGRGTKATWQVAISALNTLAQTGYQPEDFADVTITNWPPVQVE